MPTPKRWHPVSRDLNDDSELWELTDLYGDRALRVVLEVFATLDKLENRWPLAGHWLAGLSRKVRQQPATVWRVIGHMLEKDWLVAEETAADGSPTVLSSRNYWKYHKMRETKGAMIGTDTGTKRGKARLPPNLSESSLTLIREEREAGETVNSVDKSSGRVGNVGSTSEPMTPISHTFPQLSENASDDFGRVDWEPEGQEAELRKKHPHLSAVARLKSFGEMAGGQ